MDAVSPDTFLSAVRQRLSRTTGLVAKQRLVRDALVASDLLIRIGLMTHQSTMRSSLEDMYDKL